MSMRVALKLLALSVVVFAAAFATRRMFLWEVMPISWEQPAQPLWALGTAFLLRSIENVAASVALIVLAATFVLWINRWHKANSA